jgi:hypothetical protein
MAEEKKGPERDSSGRFASKKKSDEDAAAQSDESTQAQSDPEAVEKAEQEKAAAEGNVAKEGEGAPPEDETPMERVERLARGDLREGEWIEDISDTVAPSVGPKSVAFHHPRGGPRDDIDTDAMGNDKRRQVVGKSYGASAAKQATVYGIFIAVVIGLFIGGKILVDKLDQPPDHIATQAVWAKPGAPQHPPKPLE